VTALTGTLVEVIGGEDEAVVKEVEMTREGGAVSRSEKLSSGRLVGDREVKCLVLGSAVVNTGRSEWR